MQYIQIATMAHYIPDLIAAARGTSRQYDFPPPPPLSQWLPLYRDHRRICLVLTADIGDGDADGAQGLSLLFDQIRKTTRLPPDEITRQIQQSPEEFAAAQEELQQGLRSAVDEFWEELDHEIAGTQEHDPVKRLVLRRPEWQFFLRAWFPCWLLNGEYATRLLASARRGNLVALEKLLAVDKSVMADPLIARQFRDADVQANSDRLSLLYEAIESKLKPIKRSRVKASLAALIFNLSRLFPKPLETPEIQALFDAVARDFGRGLRDQDLPEQPDTFYKRIQRHRHFWRLLRI